MAPSDEERQIDFVAFCFYRSALGYFFRLLHTCPKFELCMSFIRKLLHIILLSIKLSCHLHLVRPTYEL